MTADEIREIEEAKERALQLQAMLRTPGWQAFKQMLEHHLHDAYQASAAAADAWNGAKHLGAYHALRFISDWPEREIRAISLKIRQIEDMAAMRRRTQVK